MQKTSIYFAAVCAAVMISGWAPTQILITHYDDTRAVELAALALMLSSAFLSLIRGKLLPQKLADLTSLTLLIVLALGLASSIRAPYPVYGLIEVGLLASLGISALFIRTALLETGGESLRRHLLILLAGGAILLGFRLLVDLIIAAVTRDPRGLLLSWFPFIQPRYFAKAAGWALPLLWLLPQLWPRPQKQLWIVCTIAAVIISSQLIGTGSRGALVGLTAVIVLAASLFRRPGTHLAIWLLASLAGGFAIWQLVELLTGFNTSARIVSTSGSGRDIIYSLLLNDIRAAPWLGAGPLQFSAFDHHGKGHVAGPHSLPLQVAAEWGMPALLLILGVCVRWGLRYVLTIRELCRSRSQPADAVGCIEVAIFATLVIAGTHSLVANVLNDPVSQLAAALMIGIAAPITETAPRRGHALLSRLLIVGLIIGCIGALGAAARLGYPCVNAQPGLMQMPARDGRIYPRLWSQGLIPYETTCRISATEPGS